MDKKEIHEARKQAFNKLEKQLQENVPAEDRFFYYHSSEDRVVLSHALFWIMSRPMEKKLPSIEGFLLLRKYEEEMLVAYLTLSDEFPELLRYCNLTMGQKRLYRCLTLFRKQREQIIQQFDRTFLHRICLYRTFLIISSIAFSIITSLSHVKRSFYFKLQR